PRCRETEKLAAMDVQPLAPALAPDRAGDARLPGDPVEAAVVERASVRTSETYRRREERARHLRAVEPAARALGEVEERAHRGGAGERLALEERERHARA